MRPLVQMSSIAILLSNVCQNSCANCTQSVDHMPGWFMDMDTFKKAIDSMKGFSGVVGFQGAEPLLCPQFTEMCEYAVSVLPKEQLGLWTCLPKGKEKYRETIANTFGNIFINSHGRNDILHAPILVASEELPIEQWVKDYLVDQCWVQNTWSAAINPKGAFFCEVAAGLAMLFNLDIGWPIEPGWWTRSPRAFTEQLDACCHMCGAAMPLMRRVSTEEVDDISPGMFEKLKDVSPKVKAGKYIIHDLSVAQDDRPVATYKDEDYRQETAKTYGMFLSVNERQYHEPHLFKNWQQGV